MKTVHATVVVLLVAFGGCLPEAGPDLDATRVTLDSMLQEHSRLILAGDVPAVMAHYAPDAVVRTNHAAPLRGHAAIQAFVEGMQSYVTLHSLSYVTEALAVYGDSAWHVVTFGMAGDAGGQAMADSGSAYLLWTRDTAGRWRIKHDILNSRLPLPAPAEARSGAP